LLARLPEQGFHQRRAHPAPAPFAKDRHPADAAVGQETRRADRPSFHVAGDDVAAEFVPLVPFELARHSLFLDEHCFPHGTRERQRFGPGEDADCERGSHRRSV